MELASVFSYLMSLTGEQSTTTTVTAATTTFTQSSDSGPDFDILVPAPEIVGGNLSGMWLHLFAELEIGIFDG